MVTTPLPQLVPAHEAFENIFSRVEQNSVGRRKVADVIKRLVISGDGPPPSQAQVASGERLERPKRLSPDAVNKAVKSLARLGLVTPDEPRRDGSGRPSIPLLLGGNQWFSIGVKVATVEGAVCLGVSCTDLSGRALVDFPYTESRLPRQGDVVCEIADRVLTLLRYPQLADRSLLGVGVDVSGHVRDGSEVVMSGVDEVSGREIGAHLAEALKDTADRTSARYGGAVPVIVDNDTALLAMRETYRPHQPYRNTVVVAVFPDGVGSGVVIGNRVYRGARGGSGEIGHVPVAAELGISNFADPDDGSRRGFRHPCYCGTDRARFGHLDCIAAPNRIRSELGDIQIDELPTGPGIPSGDGPDAVSTLRLAGAALGLGLATVTNLFDPEKLVIYLPPQFHPTHSEGTVGYEYYRSAHLELQRTSYPTTLDGLRLEWRPADDDHLRRLGARSAALGVVDGLIRHGKGRCKCYVSPYRDLLRADLDLD